MLALRLEFVIGAIDNFIVSVTAGAFYHFKATLRLTLTPVGFSQVVPTPGIAWLDPDCPLQVIDGLLVLLSVKCCKRLVMQFGNRLGLGLTDFKITLVAIGRGFRDATCGDNRNQNQRHQSTS